MVLKQKTFTGNILYFYIFLRVFPDWRCLCGSCCLFSAVFAVRERWFFGPCFIWHSGTVFRLSLAVVCGQRALSYAPQSYWADLLFNITFYSSFPHFLCVFHRSQGFPFIGSSPAVFPPLNVQRSDDFWIWCAQLFTTLTNSDLLRWPGGPNLI